MGRTFRSGIVPSRVNVTRDQGLCQTASLGLVTLAPQAGIV
jgi:hypothetical protein